MLIHTDYVWCATIKNLLSSFLSFKSCKNCILQTKQQSRIFRRWSRIHDAWKSFVERKNFIFTIYYFFCAAFLVILSKIKCWIWACSDQLFSIVAADMCRESNEKVKKFHLMCTNSLDIFISLERLSNSFSYYSLFIASFKKCALSFFSSKLSINLQQKCLLYFTTSLFITIKFTAVTFSLEFNVSTSLSFFGSTLSFLGIVSLRITNLVLITSCHNRNEIEGKSSQECFYGYLLLVVRIAFEFFCINFKYYEFLSESLYHNLKIQVHVITT